VVIENYLKVFVLCILAVLISSCSTVVCTTPYILHKGECCLDENEDGECDVEIFEEEILETETLLENIDEVEEIIEEEIIIEETEPEIKKGMEKYFLGSGDSDYLFVFYGDYEDKFSKKFNNEILPLIIESYGDLLRFEFKDSPEHTSKYGKKGSLATNCAGEQGKYWEYHDRLFGASVFTESDFNTFAADLGLDVFSFSSCLKSLKYLDEVQEDIEEAKENNMKIVPGFVVGGKNVVGLRTFSYFKKLLDEDFKFELKEEYLKKIFVSVNGDGNVIIPGVAALDNSVEDSPYTNNVDLITGKLYFTGEDRSEKDSILSEDIADLELEFSFFTEEGSLKETYVVEMNELITVAEIGKNYHGGLGTDFYYFGGSGGGTKLLPKTFVYVYSWGKGNVYKDGDLVEEDVDVEFYVIKGIRENSKITTVQEDDMEVYIHLPGKYKGIANELESFEYDSLYLFWEKGINFKVV